MKKVRLHAMIIFPRGRSDGAFKGHALHAVHSWGAQGNMAWSRFILQWGVASYCINGGWDYIPFVLVFVCWRGMSFGRVDVTWFCSLRSLKRRVFVRHDLPSTTSTFHISPPTCYPLTFSPSSFLPLLLLPEAVLLLPSRPKLFCPSSPSPLAHPLLF